MCKFCPKDNWPGKIYFRRLQQHNIWFTTDTSFLFTWNPGSSINDVTLGWYSKKPLFSTREIWVGGCQNVLIFTPFMNDPQAHKNVAIDLFPVSLCELLKLYWSALTILLFWSLKKKISMKNEKQNKFSWKTFSILIMDSWRTLVLIKNHWWRHAYFFPLAF